MECREGCGACCIAPSIRQAIPGMPDGKPAMVRCVNLSEDFRCLIFESPDRPECCAAFQAEISLCGDHRDDAMANLVWLESATRKDQPEK